MANRHGFPVWYELMTPDADGATSFYESVVGWSIGSAPAAGPDYRMIEADDGPVGGMLPIDEAMKAAGVQPRWLPYVGVDDTDATVEKAKSLGGTVFVPPTDIPGTGRFALLADPQGAPFYVMRGTTDGESTSFAPGRPGHFAWNELSTTDGKAAVDFYGALFGWENRETMDMGPMGSYHFLDWGETRIGALVEMKDRSATWRCYAVVRDIAASIEAVKAGGGKVMMGPHVVPTGDTIVIGADPQGAEFSLVSTPGHPE